MIVPQSTGAPRLCRLLLPITVLLLWIAPSASAFQLGIEDDTVLVDGYSGNPAAVYERGAQLHARVVRMMIDPSRIELAPDVYDWTAVDASVDTARAHGFRVWMTLSWSPWNAEDFAEFAAATAARYRDRVSDFTLINEPDFVGMTPLVYRNYFTKGRVAIRAANPIARVYIGELSGVRPIQYMRAVLKAGPIRADGFAWHPYQFTRAPESNRGRPDAIGIGRIRRMSAFLRANVRRLSTAQHKPLGMYLTEFGYLTRGRNAISDRQAAAWWPRAIQQAKRSRVRLLVAYQMTYASDDRAWDSSLFAADGTPRPAFRAIQASERRNATPVRMAS